MLNPGLLWQYGTMTQPTLFTQELADSICERLIRGESLTAICSEQGMPSTGTVRLWRHRNAAFAMQYEAAREAQAEAIFDEILDIVDDGRNDWVERHTQSGSYVALNSEAVARSKMRYEARMKLIEKLSPKRYGDKAQLDLTNSDGKLATMSDEQKAARLTAIHQAVQARKAAKQKAASAPVDPELDGSDLV